MVIEDTESKVASPSASSPCVQLYKEQFTKREEAKRKVKQSDNKIGTVC